MVELSMTFHTQVIGNNGQPQAMSIERVEGLAEIILSGFEYGSEEESGRLFGAAYTDHARRLASGLTRRSAH
jgi:hypothetical protein